MDYHVAVPLRRVFYMDYPRADDRDRDGDPLGMDEIMDLTGRSEPAVYKWFERANLPPADGPTVWGRPTWRRRTILAWAYRNRKLPDGSDERAVRVREEARDWADRVGPERVVRADALRHGTPQSA